jgi:outer membrane protein TolC
MDKLNRAGSFTGNLGGSVTAPLFDAGKLEANQHAAEAAAMQQEVAYRKTVLQSFGEVEDGLANVQGDRGRD